MKYSDKESQIPYDLAYMWNLKKQNKQTKHKNQAHRYREEIGGCQRGCGGSQGVWGRKNG